MNPDLLGGAFYKFMAPAVLPSGFSVESIAGAGAMSANPRVRCYKEWYTKVPHMQLGELGTILPADVNTFVEDLVSYYGISPGNDMCGPGPDDTRVLVIMAYRSVASGRAVENWDWMVALTKRSLPNAEVVVVDWATMTYVEQAKLAARAHCIIGIHGANLQWAYLMRRGGLLIKYAPYGCDMFVSSEIEETHKSQEKCHWWHAKKCHTKSTLKWDTKWDGMRDKTSNYGSIAYLRGGKTINWISSASDVRYCKENAPWRACGLRMDERVYRTYLRLLKMYLRQRFNC